MYHSLTKHGHASNEPQELDFTGEIKSSMFGCEVCSGGLAILVKGKSRGWGVYILKLKWGVEEVRGSMD